ncbi:hypothetical protein Y1Q_0019961 [Alligator mississippiensis]|uniref:Uncharacterized protein n=1 Tax=Alligator mississippiensis TaxID=8496 RepID=A0A151PE28_ALLMI|nr:hypothetical protein Y1Q_0019961 [Alligator mississippiensis]
MNVEVRLAGGSISNVYIVPSTLSHICLIGTLQELRAGVRPQPSGYPWLLSFHSTELSIKVSLRIKGKIKTEEPCQSRRTRFLSNKEEVTNFIYYTRKPALTALQGPRISTDHLCGAAWGELPIICFTKVNALKSGNIFFVFWTQLLYSQDIPIPVLFVVCVLR